jgi:mono/diheme cytochrome c family protein
MPAASFGQPTTMIDPTKVAESESTPEPEEVDVEFGGQVYSRLCSDCHGEALEGMSGKAEPIDAYELDTEALTNLLRTGGGFGNAHIFGLDKVSPEGIASLQAYLETIDETK